MTSEGTERRSIRIKSKLWDLVISGTVKRGMTVSDIVREKLVDWLIEVGDLAEDQREEHLR